jgi:hypothetical protein
MIRLAAVLLLALPAAATTGGPEDFDPKLKEDEVKGFDGYLAGPIEDSIVKIEGGEQQGGEDE